MLRPYANAVHFPLANGNSPSDFVGPARCARAGSDRRKGHSRLCPYGEYRYQDLLSDQRSGAGLWLRSSFSNSPLGMGLLK